MPTAQHYSKWETQRHGERSRGAATCRPEPTKPCAFQVLAAVFGPREVELRSQMQNDRAIVKCEYSMAAFSTGALNISPPLPGAEQRC
jgi:hypothetical protein